MKAESPTTRGRILQQGLDLISKSGVSGVTLGQLADEAHMSKSGLFAHFGSKEELQISLLDKSAEVAQKTVVAPAMLAAEGLPRLEALVQHWLGWSSKAGLSGGCPVAAGLFELDDVDGPLREKVLAMEREWRKFLTQLAKEAIGEGHLRADLDVPQFVWELCGIYLSHHASFRFVRDPHADQRAKKAFEALLDRARPVKVKGRINVNKF